MIRSAAVLGAGTMGSQIAAHLANAGVPTLLLDLDSKLAREGFGRACKLKPDPLFTREAASLVTMGGFECDLTSLGSCDWIIECIVERLDAKRALLEKIEPHWRAGSIVSSNTSGIPIAAIAEGRSLEFRRHWLGTHFFNPPRYLRLLEVIPTAETKSELVSTIRDFSDHRLGKGVVIAKDTPNFIGNRVALFGVIRTLEAMAAGQFTVEEVDAMTGPALGRPNRATFRTLDTVGLDIVTDIVGNLSARLSEGERAVFTLPPVLAALVKRGWIGEKAGQGFYRRQDTSGGHEILTLDLTTFEYRPRQSARLPDVDRARAIEDVGERIRSMFLASGRVGTFTRQTLGSTLVYAARIARDIAHSIDDVDRAMRWGFGWELGPFEIWDVIGIPTVLDACGVTDIPALVQERLDSGHPRFRDKALPAAGPDLQILRSAKDRQRIVRRNAGASLVDLDDGVLVVEFHSKMNTIGADTVDMVNAGVREASRNFSALVVGNDAPDFSAGANLMLLLLEAQEGNWDELDLMARAFQASNMGLRYADVPVVVAPSGLSLGGGCEISLHGDRIQAAAETYLGLVEVGVGIIPAGGGTKEMIVRSTEHLPPGTPDLAPWAQRAFETIAFARVSTSGVDARRLGYLRDTDGITMNRERLIADAKTRALARARDGYQRPSPRTAIPVGGESVLAALKLGVHLAWRAGRISEHDALIARKLAAVIAGGALPHPALVSEQYLLDLEREAFLSLAGEPKTQARMQHMLKTGKALRN